MPKLGTTELKTHGRIDPKKQTSIRIVSAVASTTNLTMTFDQPIVLRGTPNWATDVPGATPVSAASPTVNSVVITFSALIAAATEVIIPVADPAIRNMVGGFVADTTFPL